MDSGAPYTVSDCKTWDVTYFGEQKNKNLGVAVIAYQRPKVQIKDKWSKIVNDFSESADL